LQQGLQHLQNAYVNFWAKRAKYPAFKSKRKSRASATFTTSGFRYRNGQIWLAKMSEPLDIRWSRPLPEGAEPSTVTVSRDAAGRWHISILTGFCPSSKTCSACGHQAAEMPLNVREWTCTACGVRHDRDVNAAKVIRAEGLSVLACGDGVRLPRT
jgi:transposase